MKGTRPRTVLNVSIEKLVQNGLLVARRPDLVLRRRQYVLVFSHMRSYSSLLCHLLGSHPEIDGYAEMHRSYRRRLDLVRLNAHVYRSLGGSLDGRYVLDKVLHDAYLTRDSILESSAVYPIFLVRKPEAALASIIEMGRRVSGASSYSDPRLAAIYYERRLRTLSGMAERVERRCLFVRAEQVVDDTRSCLDTIERFLSLGSRLPETYSLFVHTGDQGWGDDSGWIRQGRIVRDRQRSDVRKIDDELLLRATRAYNDCCRVFEQRRWSQEDWLRPIPAGGHSRP